MTATERDPVRAALADKIAGANLVTMHHWNAQMGWDDETELTSEDQDVIVAALNAPLSSVPDCGAADYVLVPRKITTAMIAAGWSAFRRDKPPVQLLGPGKAFVEAWDAMIEATLPRAVDGPADDLEKLVSRFAARLLAKLKLARANGRSGWERDDWEQHCQLGLLRHLEKGDPRDVAAYCAFMDHHGWITKATLPRAVDGGVAGEREAAIHDALLGLIEAVELDSDTGGKGISGYTAARLHDARETLSAFPRSEC